MCKFKIQQCFLKHSIVAFICIQYECYRDMLVCISNILQHKPFPDMFPQQIQQKFYVVQHFSTHRLFLALKTLTGQNWSGRSLTFIKSHSIATK